MGRQALTPNAETDMAMTPAMTMSLLQVAQAAQAAGHGGKQAVYDAACARLGVSLATLMRGLAQVALRPARKQRSDAGDVWLPEAEAMIISALLMESLRKNKKRLLSIGQALEIARTNGMVRAERVDPASGEIVQLGEAAVSRALRGYGVHPDQLLQPAPAVELKSLHPNHVWQIDASLCVLYYLNARTAAESGLQVMEAKRFNKNKPANLKRIESGRVWSYEVTDHNSGSGFLTYVFGAESGANIAESFIEAITPREGDPFHGVPQILMMDMGSANTSGLFTNLLRRLQVKPLPHAPENARATGQVENFRNIIERSFESSLRFKSVASLDELKAYARQWSRWFNATRVHTRHGRTRTDQWLRITEQQLRLAPPPERCRELLTHAPVRRRVTDHLRVEFGGDEYCVKLLPRVMVGEWLQVTYNPYVPKAAMVVDKDEQGHELLHMVPLVARDDDGFSDEANVIGEDYSRPPVTLADVNRSEVSRIAMGAATVAEADALRKSRALPFGGLVDPYKPITDTKLPTYLKKRGTSSDPKFEVSREAMPEPELSLYEVATALAALGVQMSPAVNEQIATWYPTTKVPASEIDGIPERLAACERLRQQGLARGMLSPLRDQQRVDEKVSLVLICQKIRAMMGAQYELSTFAELEAAFSSSDGKVTELLAGQAEMVLDRYRNQAAAKSQLRRAAGL